MMSTFRDFVRRTVLALQESRSKAATSLAELDYEDYLTEMLHDARFPFAAGDGGAEEDFDAMLAHVRDGHLDFVASMTCTEALRCAWKKYSGVS